MKRVGSALLLLLLLPMAPGLAAARGNAHPAATAAAAQRGRTFAETHCAQCHAITANGTSPNPEAPPWDDVANREGLTAQTFATFLADAHNYPAAMDFRVERRVIGDIAAYMLTLRRQNYKPTR